ncbi:MAG: hypothetical protein IT581_02085 [Verrucomicrobiales bacterium]|nr:hypothetical protein [Verrucomicrobiales bacterium]
MIILEALNALAGDCLLLRYPGPDGKERLWLIDGGPRANKEKNITVWKDVLLPRLRQINAKVPIPITLGMVSHIDDDHINGIQKITQALTAATPAKPAPVKFQRFWFNSFDKLVGPKPQGLSTEAETASVQSLVSSENFPGVEDELATAVMESVSQGNALASDLRTLKLEGNVPLGRLVQAKPGQPAIDIEGAKVTILGPRKDRLEKLRADWQAALKHADKATRQAALQELFLPASKQDKSVPNLSSIVVLVKIGKRTLLLTGDAHGDDIVTAWNELGLPKPAKVDVLKMPHHGSIRNCTQPFLAFFQADHYVISADGLHDNPDAPAVEALVKMHGQRNIVLHFTNEDITWSKAYTIEKNRKKVKNLRDLLAELKNAYGGPWTTNIRKATEHSVVVKID